MKKDIKKFSVTSGQLVRIKSIAFKESGDFEPVKTLAVILDSYECDWTFISNNPPAVKVVYRGGKIEKVKPIKIEFIEDMSDEEKTKHIMSILTSI